MEVRVEEVGPTQRKVSITIPAADVDAAFNKAYREVGKTARVPGFRQGKVPRNLLDARYGSQVRDDVRSELVSSSFARAIQDKNISPVTMPTIESTGDLSQGASFSYVAEVEIQPNIELKCYTGLYVPPLEKSDDETEITAELEHVRREAAQLVPVMLRDVVQEGDIVLMDYEGSVGGVPFEGGKAEGALIEIGGETYLPGFSEGLLGAKVPSERTLAIDFPADYRAKHLAGKQASFTVKVKEIKRRELPNLDDEFARDHGAEGLQQLRERISGSVKQRRENRERGERRRRLLQALVEANPFELASGLVKAQADRMIEGAAMQIQQMTGQQVRLSDEDIASLRKENQADAELHVRAGILMLEVAKQEKIEVGDDDVEHEIAHMAEHAGNAAQRLIAHYSDEEHRSQLRYRLLEDKTVNFLLEHAVDTPAPGDKAPPAGEAKQG